MVALHVSFKREKGEYFVMKSYNMEELCSCFWQENRVSNKWWSKVQPNQILPIGAFEISIKLDPGP